MVRVAMTLPGGIVDAWGLLPASLRIYERLLQPSMETVWVLTTEFFFESGFRL